MAVPWTNEIFYYGIVALDDQANRGQISNLVAVYIHEETTTTTTTTSTTTKPLVIQEEGISRRFDVVEDEEDGEDPASRPSVFRIISMRNPLPTTIPYLSKVILNTGIWHYKLKHFWFTNKVNCEPLQFVKLPMRFN